MDKINYAEKNDNNALVQVKECPRVTKARVKAYQKGIRFLNQRIKAAKNKFDKLTK